jgi:hypothetical protein
MSGKVIVRYVNDAEKWDEMPMRQLSLDIGREAGGTHFAVIDCDEMVTHNLLPEIRRHFEFLRPGQLLEYPMIPVWGDKGNYRDDDSVWCKAWLTLGFCDRPGITWRPGTDGYQYHNRPPFGSDLQEEQRSRPIRRGDGGVMHMQFMNRRRIIAKHVLYRMVDHLRWPDRDTVQGLNWKFDQALDERGMKLSPIKYEWWFDYPSHLIYLYGTPWQEQEVKRLLSVHGKERFRGLDLKGLDA